VGRGTSKTTPGPMGCSGVDSPGVANHKKRNGWESVGPDDQEEKTRPGGGEKVNKGRLIGGKEFGNSPDSRESKDPNSL